MTGAPVLALEGVAKRFGDMDAVRDLSLTLDAGEILVLVGPSGCGKTTTLRMIAGFEAPDAGRISLAGRDITGVPPEKRGIGIVFQDYALFPHMTVAENILFGAPERNGGTVARYAAMVGLTGLESRYPDQLSGGQQQRVALARTLAAEPRLILLDEPFSNLDAALRDATRREIRRLLKASGRAVILVTHDQEEALGFADRVAVLRGGRLLQCGPAREVYDRPVDAFVARALGRANLVPGIAAGLHCETPLGTVALATPAVGPVTLAVRPRDVTLRPVSGGEAGNAEVVAVEFKGHHTACLVRRGDLELEAETPSELTEGDEVVVGLRADATPQVLGAAG